MRIYKILVLVVLTACKLAEHMHGKGADLQLIRGLDINAIDLPLDSNHILLICILQANDP